MRIADEQLLSAIVSRTPVTGYTHNFYRYPARFSPLFVREVIRQFSQPGDVVLDPFMGGGTTIIEALAAGRRATGVDLNSLAVFVSDVKTAPLAPDDHLLINEWLDDVVHEKRSGIAEFADPVPNLSRRTQQFLADMIEQSSWLPLERQRRFLRCALLRTARWALDRDKPMAPRKQFVQEFERNVREMLVGLQDFVTACATSGFRKTQIKRSRLLRCRSAIGLEEDKAIRGLDAPRLIVTSPPYPGVHILYHRWQIEDRRETPAPYWLAALNDGHFAAHYTFGSRTRLGLDNYFRNVEECFRSVRRIVAPDAAVVQLVAFSDAESQLPRYLAAMKRAGFAELDALAITGDNRVWRSVPNRKWYCYNGKEQDSAKEVVLFHRPD